MSVRRRGPGASEQRSAAQPREQRTGPRIRIDRALVNRGLAPNRERAQRLIMAGAVWLAIAR